MIVLGIFLLITGGSMWNLGDFLHSQITTLVGLLLFLGGLVSFFGGISDYLNGKRYSGHNRRRKK